jgi:predicted SnoaL-like aldol condensation-catalyzing enzyme
LSERNRTLVSRAIDELFVSKDITAADRYWSDPYLQHNPIAKSGVSTFRALMASLISSASFSYQRYLTLAECDLAVVYGRYSQSGVIFDMFRVQNDKIVEHWDSDSNQASPTSAVGALDATAASAAHRQLFLDLAAAVLVGADRSRVSEFLSVDYIDHRNTGTPGPTALTTMLTAEDIAYTRVHHVIADGNFVFALSEGKRGSTNYGFYDLFRAESSKFVERWDSRRTVPNSTASGLAIF